MTNKHIQTAHLHWQYSLICTILLSERNGFSCDTEPINLTGERFGVEPGESVFIDDTPINAEAAQYIGMTAFVFHGDVGELRKWLTDICAP